MWPVLLAGCFNLQGDRIHCCPRSRSLSVPHTCCHWEQSQGRTCNLPHTRPRNQKARLHQGTSLGMSSRTSCRSCWVGRPGLHMATEVEQGVGWREREREKRRGKTGVPWLIIGVALLCITAVLLSLCLSKDNWAFLLLIKKHFTLTRGTEHLFSQPQSHSFKSLLQLTTEFWRPPLIDFSSSLLASICVGLKLVA